MQDLPAKKTCKICQKELRTGKIYCSKKCYWKKSPKFKTKCKECGKSFITYPSFVKANQGFLCSKDCKYKWISKNYRGKNSKAGFKNAQVNIICRWCKNEFKLYKSQVGQGKGVFCNRKCRNEWFAKNSIGENAPRWIDGSSFLPYGSGFTRKIKREIKTRDNYTCQKCGIKEKLSIHHINYDKNDNSKENLITLCIACNIKDISLNKNYDTRFKANLQSKAKRRTL